ncbi:Putative endonuclease, Z1 domain containing protein [Spirosomataceae bacterium]
MNKVYDELKSLIISQYNQFHRENGAVGRDFFESEVLKERIKNIFKTIYPHKFDGEEYDLSDMTYSEKYNAALKDVRFTHKTTINPSISLQNNYNDSWLSNLKINEIGWDNDERKDKTYRGRYLKYLDKKLGRSKKIIEETNRSSLEIIKKIGDPKSTDNFFVKGLVVGSVQSGKTSNFNAVVNSAIDVGYELIIVLSGIMEDLRRQTQIRTQKEVVGEKRGTFIGVGEVASFGIQGDYKDVGQIIVPTSIDRDFNLQMKESDFSLNHKNILICKKNTSVLQNLLLWLKAYLNENNDKHNIPFLIIDDEADNASINNLGHKGKDYANKINGHIRALLALFNRKTYIGYTATPFANILQDWNIKPDNKWIIKDNRNNIELEFEQEGNLFPDDFIELLNPPSNYIGPKNFFETRIEDVKKIDPLLAAPITDNIEYFPERVEVLLDGSLVGVKKYNNITEFENDANARTRFGTFRDYREVTRATRPDDNYPKAIPKSLDEAIKCFIISIAIRLSRRPELIQSMLFHPHNTMLIHISRFSNWQCTSKILIAKLINDLEFRLRNDSLNEENSIFSEFHRIWVIHYAYAVRNIKNYLPADYEDEYLTQKTFHEVRDLLVEAINGIEVKAVNTVENDALDYEGGEKKYIVIGGNRLSRGFTLEGLTINYFIRNTNYADTLLQMGRWFGYRPGYLDCCKLFTTADTFEKFDQVTWTIEELEEEFKKLSRDKMKPKDYAIKVLTHPGTLQITRPAILRNAVTETWSYEDKLVQTTEFELKADKISNSWENFKRTYQEYAPEFIFDDNRNFIILKKDTQALEDFLNSTSTYTGKFEKNAILRFIKLCNQYEKLTNWTIAINTSGSLREIPTEYTGFNTEVKLTKRSGPKEGNRFYKSLYDLNIFIASGNSSNIVTSPSDLSLVLTESEKNQAEEKFRSDNPGKNPPERIYREKMKDSDGLLVIYLMDLKAIFYNSELETKANNENIDLNIPLVGFAIGIPPLKVNIGGQYLVNMHILENIQNNPIPPIIDEEEIEDEIEDEYEGIEL